MASRFSVGKQVGQLNGKSGWWFVVYIYIERERDAREESTGALDEKWKHMHWQWQRV